jgi:hypothetical protein
MLSTIKIRYDKLMELLLKYVSGSKKIILKSQKIVKLALVNKYNFLGKTIAVFLKI